ncbi:E3 ubiquitin-protein ligase SH3RF1-like isoform X2 [Apostichopus japonicus]|uniref:E3 ubiquitin-protein ligase SH3RF1-like isoform X2 n=1 Tax=Stichopus japonicus TaxID=307972 RepID=UPI003AB4D74B
MESIFDILECSVCLERLDATSRILPCQHTFCVRCLSTILKTNNDLRCPECREPVPITDVKELPTNILLVRILDGLVKPPGTPSTSEEPTTPSSAGVKNSSNVFKPLQPFARAKFNYERKETGDLSFSKGDVIFLKKKLDDNWYVGEVNGQTGFFPANHVEVIHPLQDVVPSCKALYDFEVAQNREKDILTFNKNEVLKVIRRVDDNWVEGQKGDKIGIFPISFVEFNDPAKNLLEVQQGTVHHSPQSSSSSGEGHHSPQSSSSSSGEGNMDLGAAGVSSRPGGNRNKSSSTKRHSFTSVLGVQLRPNQEHRTNGPTRHSMEISSPELVRSSNPIAANLLGARHQGPVTPPTSSSSATTAVTTSSTPTTHEVTAGGNNRKKPPPLAAVPMVLLGGGSVPGSPSAIIPERGMATSPRPVEVYKARHSYKPQHPDELEVSIGEIFAVQDFCSDGWFRGMSLSSGKTGVFPGNYVEPYRVKDDPKVTGPSSPGPSSPGLHYVFPTFPQSVVRPKLNSANSTTPAASSPTQVSGKGAKSTVKPPTSPAIMQHDSQKTVAQLQIERNRQQQLLREFAYKPGNSQHSSSSLAASPPVLRRMSRNSVGNKQLNLTANRRPMSGTGVPLSVLERMLHDDPGFSPPDSNHSSRNGFRRQGARGRSKSASRILSKTAAANMDGDNNSSSPDEGGGGGKQPGEEGRTSSPHSQKESRGKTRRKSTSSDQTQQQACQVPPPPIRNNPPIAGDPPIYGATGGNGVASNMEEEGPPKTVPLARERYRVVDSYPAHSDVELALNLGDTIFVHKKREDGWYKGTSHRTGKTGLFPGIFVEKL